MHKIRIGNFGDSGSVAAIGTERPNVEGCTKYQTIGNLCPTTPHRIIAHASKGGVLGCVFLLLAYIRNSSKFRHLPLICRRNRQLQRPLSPRNPRLSILTA